MTECDTGEYNGMKKAIMQVTYFRMASWLIYCFIVILFYIEKKWLLMRNLAVILPLKSKFSEKLQRFNAIDGSIEMLNNIWISKNFN